MHINDNRNREYENAGKGGIGFFGLLGIVFIVLKLVGVINWSWIWVLAPIWCPPVLAAVGILLLAVIAYVGDRLGV